MMLKPVVYEAGVMDGEPVTKGSSKGTAQTIDPLDIEESDESESSCSSRDGGVRGSE
jgi:hypothetical protein